ncbi:hypothetical protein [Streptomyces sp. NPDC057545]|uniref:hypothetical protein n=1 Tax=Streptomyces sp. NPDC057545 TaxID=3346164 RepID=UPI00367CABAE
MTRTARAELGRMLSSLFIRSGLGLRQASRESGVPLGALRAWKDGESAPGTGREDDFWSVVRLLRQTADRESPTDAQWTEALRAAQQEGPANQARQHYVGVHHPADEVPATPARDRTAERAVMDAFAQETGAEAPTYLCWCADAPVGKTALLADYVLRHPPDTVDILSYFVSPAHRTDTLAAFETELARQLGTFLGEHPAHPPQGAAEWSRLFGRAAAKSSREKRNLLLVVDGLDDDVAWPGDVADSIAGLLPSAPPPGMRVLVSLRSSVRPPDDLPSDHPLRDMACQHPLGPVAGAAHVRQPLPDPAALGESVAGLLGVSGGGLCTADLADLVGLRADRLDRLFQGPAGRALVLDDRVAGTYRLAGPQLEREVREGLGDTGVAQYAQKLIAWVRSWQDAGWPAATPPFPLAAPPALFSDIAARTAYALDPGRLYRISVAAGVGVALDQLGAFEASFADASDASDDLAALVPLAAARDMVRREAREVSEGAPPLMTRLGDAARARGLALSAPTPTARAVHLSDMAVELALAKRPGADAVVREAVECLSQNRAAHDSSGNHPLVDVWARLLASALKIRKAAGPGAARPLLLAVVGGHGAGVGELAESGRLLAEFGDLDLMPVLIARAEMLSAGPARARAASVDLWVALARAKAVDSKCAGDRIEDICAELERDDVLGAVNVLAASASALARLPASRPHKAAALAREAQALVFGLLPAAKTGLPSEEGQAHLHPELKGALTRLAQAVADTKATQEGLRRLKQQLGSLPESLSVGVLGELMTERGQWIVREAEKRLDHEEQERAEKEAERDERQRAEKQAKRREQDRKNYHYKRAQAQRKAEGRSAPVPVFEDSPQPRVPLPPAPRRAPALRKTWGLPVSADDPQTTPPHRLLLQEAEDRLYAGNREESRELLEAALRTAPRLQAPAGAEGPCDPELWSADLCQALGTTGRFDDAAALVAQSAEPASQARHLAALSLGCSLGGHGGEGADYAAAARELLPDDADPVLAARVNQALAYAGAESVALAPITGGTSAQRRQADAAVAVGVARHRPEEAVCLAEGLAAKLARRIAAPNRTGPLRVLPELATLLLAAPDVLPSGSRLRNALHQAVREVTGSPAPQHAATMTVLTLLGRLGCLSDETAEAAEAAVGRWRCSLRPGPGSGPEIALLAAVDGDIDLAWRHAESLRTPAEQSLALGAVAAHLAGAETPPATDPQADDRMVRFCLALARAATRDGPSRRGSARHTVHRLLRTGGWTRAFPALPGTAPEALPHLAAIALHARRQRAPEPDTGANDPPC